MAKPAYAVILLLVMTMSIAASAAAQTPQPGGPPRVISFNGTITGADNQPVSGSVSITFSLYKEQADLAPIWTEAQTVQLDERGRYYVWLGQQTNLPMEMFQSGAARWLGITAAGLPEQPRLRVLSVPYALKAGDAETLGGLPASAFLRSSETGKSRNDAQGVVREQVAGLTILDQVIADDLIVVGHACISSLCVNGEFLPYELRVKSSFYPAIELFQTNAVDPEQRWLLRAGHYFTLYDQTSGRTPFWIETGAPTYAFNMNDAGFLGLGSGNPQHKLDVIGTGSTYERLKGTGGNAGVILESGSTNTALLKSTSSDASFTIDNPAGAERLRVTFDGKVGINTPNPPHTLSITAAASSYTNLISLGGNAGHIFTSGPREAVIRLNIADGSFVWENPNGTERMRITQAGNVGIGTTNPTNPLQMGSGAYVSAGGVWTNASSRTLKDHIVDLTAARALEAFAQLQPVTFSYKAEPNQTHVGFIAEDVPDLVATAGRKNLAAMDIVALVTRVVQEQQATITSQQASIAEQQAAIADLKARLARLEGLLVARGGSR